MVSVEVSVRDGSSLSTEVLEVLHGRITERKEAERKASQDKVERPRTVKEEASGSSCSSRVEALTSQWRARGGGGPERTRRSKVIPTQEVVASQRGRVETGNGRLRREVPARSRRRGPPTRSNDRQHRPTCAKRASFREQPPQEPRYETVQGPSTERCGALPLAGRDSRSDEDG